jgi:hygromycin-B 7''-O-kinase
VANVLKLPDEVPVSDEALRAIAHRHGLPTGPGAALPTSGIINSVYAIGADFVLRVPRDHPGHVEQLKREKDAIPLAVAAGVRTPEVIAYDDACDIVPVPYLVVARVKGRDAESLESVDIGPVVWDELGRDLRRLHEWADPSLGWTSGAGQDVEVLEHPSTSAEARRLDGWLAPQEARWLRAWTDHLEQYLARPARTCLVHGDVQMSNLMVHQGQFEALLDWGCARHDDPVADFVALPLRLADQVLGGYERAQDGSDPVSFRARILWRRIQVVLTILPRGTAAGCSWAEHPTSWLIDNLRFFSTGTLPEPWTTLRPPPSL